MPAPSVVLQNIATAIASLTGGTRMWSDIATDFDHVAKGATRFQVKSIATTVQRNSNEARTALGLQITVAHRLANPNDERAYTEGARLTAQQSLVDPIWWAGIASNGIPGVREVLEPPDTGLGDLTRTNDVITYTLTLSIVCVTP